MLLPLSRGGAKAFILLHQPHLYSQLIVLWEIRIKFPNVVSEKIKICRKPRGAIIEKFLIKILLIFKNPQRMKKMNFQAATQFLLLIVFSFISLVTQAQESTSSSNKTVTTTTTKFEMQPWMWILGGAVLVIIIIALMSGRNKTEVSRTTVVNEPRS